MSSSAPTSTTPSRSSKSSSRRSPTAARCSSTPAAGRSSRATAKPIHLTVIDELAYYSATVGTKAAAGEVLHHACATAPPGAASAPTGTSLATQRPSTDIVPSSLRDLFGYRWAFRCATDDSSDVVLGKGAAEAGYTAAAIADEARGVGLLRAEGKRIPRRVKAAYLTD